MSLLTSIGPALWRLVAPARIPQVKPDCTCLYREDSLPGIKPNADVYLPPGAGPHPSVILLHGGGFVLGSRRMKSMVFLAGELRQAGFAVVSVDYRMIFRGGRLDEALDDVDKAIEWWYAQAKRWNLDSQCVSILGCSAGAALMVLSAKKHRNLQKLVGVYGVYDFTQLPGHPNPVPATLLLKTREPEDWAARSPQMVADHPGQMALLHGTKDTLVSHEQSEAVAKNRQEQGLPVRLHLYDGQPHGFFQDGPGRDGVPNAMNDILEFLSVEGCNSKP